MGLLTVNTLNFGQGEFLVAGAFVAVSVLLLLAGKNVTDSLVPADVSLWRYVLSLPVDDEVYRVDFDDWMYLIDQQTLANRSFMSKFGVELGQVTLFFRRES